MAIRIWELTGDELATFLAKLNPQEGINKVSIADDGGSLKLKVNEDMWTAPLAESK